LPGNCGGFGKCRMYGQKAAAGTAGLTIDCLVERSVVGKPLVNESVELSMLSQN